MATTVRTDVLIVGAGPTGLMLANCLAKLGVDFLLLDAKSGPTRESRALVLQARTLEVYDQLGLADRVLGEADVASQLVPGFEGRRFRPVNLQRLATGVTPYPHLYVLEQSKNERLLVDNLEQLGGRVLWSHPVDDLTTDPSGRVICTTGGEDPLLIDARYCVGADGSSSVVRECSGIPFEGETNDHTFYVIDGHQVEGLVPESINLRFGARDFLLTFPMGGDGDQRLLGVARGPADAVTESSVKDTLQGVFGVGYGSARWFATYRVHHRVAARFRDGAVFLAGDAAHVHSPVGAQGMNTGLQDAHNLACKIGDVISGRAADSYLDRFAAERRPVAERLVATTDALFGLITSDHWAAQALRRTVVRGLAPLVAALVPRLTGSSRIFEYLSQTRIHYWMGDDARRSARGRRGRVVGRRLPWNGENHQSLRTMAWQIHAYGGADRRAVKRIGWRLGLPVTIFRRIRNRRIEDGACYLVRPDGFVAAESRTDSAAEDFAAHFEMIART